MTNGETVLRKDLPSRESLFSFVFDFYNHKLKERKHTILLLNGELGAGKTSFVQALKNPLGIEENITSPTFNLMNIHEGLDTTLYHFDLYRLASEIEIGELGFLEIWSGHDTDRKSICAIEWPERASHWLGALPGKIVVHLDYLGEGRQIAIDLSELKHHMP